MNNGCREDHNNSYCYFHPREVVIGVCPLCLNERLLILASTQGRRSSTSTTSSSSANYAKKKPPINFHKIFDFGSLLHRLEFRPWKSDLHGHHDHDHDHDGYVSTSQEDSFISIKFEENGMASWEKNHHHNNNNNKVASKVSLESCNKMSWNHHTFGKDNHQHSIPNNKEATKTVIEHGKPRASSLRWRKRIGHVFQLIRWKRSNKAGTVCHVSTKVEGVKVRKGWIRTLTKKRTTTME